MAKLKYLFIAVYKDGTIFRQCPEDVSAKDPARSAFSDVHQANLRHFILIGWKNCGEPGKTRWWGKHRWLVDLTDGHFEVDGVPFRFHDLSSRLQNFQLIFFRKHQHHATVNIRSGKIGRQWEEPVVYRLGWQATDPLGKIVERVMEIE